MKKIIILFFTIHTCDNIYAQQDTISSTANSLATQIAQRIKDSLSLSDFQQVKLQAINILLHRQKMAVRQKYASMDSLTFFIQRIEYTRDSLYQQVLPDDKYLLYKQKKTNLVNYH